MGVSTLSQSLNWLLASSLYFTISLILFNLYSIKNVALKILAGILQALIFGIGYFSGSVGILGMALIFNDFTVDRTISLSDNLIYEQYSLGSAPSWYRGIEISIQQKSKWLPGFEKEIFRKQYDYDTDVTGINNGSTLHSYNFNVKYIPLTNKLLLLDSARIDTINLK